MPFYTRRNEITIQNGCLMWGIREIIPSKFHQSGSKDECFLNVRNVFSSSQCISTLLVLKLNTPYISLLSVLIKDRDQCYASLHSQIHECVWNHDLGKTPQREDYTVKSILSYRQNYQYITNVLASTHYLTWVVVCCFPNSTKWLSSLYITFHLWCKCSTFFGTRTHSNAHKRRIEICLL